MILSTEAKYEGIYVWFPLLKMWQCHMEELVGKAKMWKKYDVPVLW